MTNARRRPFRFPWRTAKQIRDDVDEELRFHLDMRIDALIALGASPDDARRQALREFGDIDDARHYIGAVDRDIEAAQRRSDMISDFMSDLSYAVRKLRAAPAFTLAAVLTLALGIGANTAMFSVVNGVLLQPPPFSHPDHLVRIRFSQQGHGDAGTPMDIVDYPSRAHDFVGFSIIEGATANVVRNGADAERVQGVRVNANWFDLLRVKPLSGRFFAAGEDQQGAQNVVVLSEQLWRRDFGADPHVIGSTININAAPFTIIGIVPAAQRYPITAELWTPKIWDARDLSDGSRGARWLSMLARVKDDVDLSSANAEVRHISEELEKRFPEVYRERRARIVSVQDVTVGDMRKPLFIMLGAVALVLLIACANVANLMLVRATAREGEMAVRTALGAGRGRLARQLMTESLLLSLFGGGVGVAVAFLGMRALLSRTPAGIPLVADVSIDLRTLAITAIVSIASGVIFGLLPAMQVGRSDLASALRAGARGARSRRTTKHTKQVIVVSEVALAVTLLVGAGLLLHSFQKLLSVDPGFRPEGVMSMKLVLPQRRYDSTTRRNFARELERRARAIPGVTAVGLANLVPLDGGGNNFSFQLRGKPVPRASDAPSAEVRHVTPDFFAALGIPLLSGRGILASDQPATPQILVVNEAFVKRFLGSEKPIGQRVELHWGDDSIPIGREIVGVVGDVRSSSLTDPADPTVYVPMAQRPYSSMTIVARTNASPATLVAPLRAIVRDLDRDVPVYSIQTMDDRISSSVDRQGFYATLIMIFATIALVLAAIGLYGVIAFAVSQRTHELGIRIALGATAKGISGMVVREGLVLAAIGGLVGIAGSIFAAKLLAALLFGVGTADPLTLASVVALLGVVAAVASWIPARRASRADPLVAIRGE